MSDNTGGLFEEAKGSNDSVDASAENSSTSLEDTIFASLDIPQDTSKTTTTPESTGVASDEVTETPIQLASLSPDLTQGDNQAPKPADTAKSLPAISIDTSVVSRSTTVPLASSVTERSKGPVEDRGFGTGFKETAFNMVTGMTSLVTNESKTFEERIVTPDKKMTERASETAAQLGLVAKNVVGDLTGLQEDTKTASAIGQQLSDHWTKVKSGNMEAIGSTTAFVGSLAVPGAMATKGGTGLVDDAIRAQKTLQTATSADDLLSLANRVRVARTPATGLVDDGSSLATRLAPEANTAVSKVPTVLTDAAQTAKVPLSQTIKTGIQTRVVDPLKQQAARLGQAIDNTLTPPLQLEAAGGITMPRTALSAGDDLVTGAARSTVRRQATPFTAAPRVKPVDVIPGMGDDLANRGGSQLDDLLTVKPAQGKPQLVDKVDNVPGANSLIDDAKTVTDDARALTDEATSVADKPRTLIDDSAKPNNGTTGALDDTNLSTTKDAGDLKPGIIDKADEGRAATSGAKDSNAVVREADNAKPGVVDKADEGRVANTGPKETGPVVRETGDTAGGVAQSADDAKLVNTVDDTRVAKPLEGPRVNTTPDEVLTSNTGRIQTAGDDTQRLLTETTKVVDDAFEGTANQAVKRDLGKVEIATREIMTGKATAETFRSLDDAMANLSKSMGERLPNQFDDISTQVNKLRTTSEVTTNVARLGDEFAGVSRQLTTSADELTTVVDDISTRSQSVAQSNQLDDIAKLTDEISSGTGNADTITRLNTTVKDVSKTLSPDDAKALVDKVDEVVLNQQRANATSGLMRQTSQTADDFSALNTSLDDISSGVANKAQVEEIRTLASQVAKGSTDANTVVKLNNAVKGLKGSLDPSDFEALTTRTNNLTRSARQVTSTREVIGAIANQSDTAVQATRTLTQSGDNLIQTVDDVSTRLKAEAPNALAKQQLDDISQLSRTVRDGATDSATINRLNTTVRELGENLGPQYTDDFTRIVQGTDDITIAAQRNVVTKELAQQSVRVGNGLTNTTTALDDLAVKLGSSSPNVSRQLESVRNLSNKIANGTASKTTPSRLNKAVSDLAESLGPKYADEIKALTSGVDELTISANRANTLRDVSTRITSSGDDLVKATGQLKQTSQSFNQVLDDMSAKATSDAAGQNIQAVRELSKRLSAGSLDDVTLNQFNNAVRELGKVVGPDDLVKVMQGADELGLAARRTLVSRDIMNNVSRASDMAIDASKLVSSSADEVSNTLQTMTRELAETGSGPNVLRIEKDLKSLQTATRKVGSGTADSGTLRNIETTLNRLNRDAATNPRLASHLDDLNNQMNTMGLSFRQSQTARDVAASVTRSGDDLIRATDSVVSNVQRIERSVSTVRNSVAGSLDDAAARELDNITTAVREIAEGATDPRTIGRLETSVNRLVQTSGTRFGDDVTRLVDDSRELVRTTRELRTAREGFTSTLKSTGQVPSIADDLASHSNRVSNNISLLSNRAAASRAPQIVDDLNVLEDVTRQIGTRTDTAASIRRAEEALSRLSRTTNRQLGDDIATVVDDTRALIKRTRETGAQNIVKTTTDDLVGAGDDLANTIQRTRQQVGETLPQTVTRELDEISNAARSLGQNGSDDALAMSRIESSFRTIERTGPQGRSIASSIRESIDNVQTTAIQSRRALNLRTVTDDALNSSRQISNIARNEIRNLSANGTPSRLVRRQLDEIAETADNIAASSNPSVGVKSIQRNIEVLRRNNVRIPEGLESTVRVLDDSLSASNAIRHMDTSRSFIGRSRDLIARTADDGTHVVTNTRQTVVNSLDNISDELSTLTRTQTPEARSLVMSNIDESINTIRNSGNAKLANEIDEAVKVRNLESIQSSNAQLAANLESSVKSLNSSSGTALARSQEATTLTTIETIAKEIAGGNTNSNLIAALERNSAKLTRANQEVLKPLVDDLKNGIAYQAEARSQLVASSANVVMDDLARISSRGNIGTQLDRVADVRQRLDLIRFTSGSDTPLLEQMRNSLVNLEDGLLRQAQPKLLGQAAKWTGSKLGLGTYSPYSVDGLSSTSGRVRDLATRSNNRPGIANSAKIIFEENPGIYASAAMNSGLLVGSYFVADHLLKSHLTEINRLAAQLREQSETRKEAMSRQDAPRAEADSQERASFLKVNTEKPSTRVETDSSDTEVALEFSPAVAEVVRRGETRLSEAAIDIIKRTGITGSEHEIMQALHDYRDTGKVQRWRGLASLPSLPVEVAQTIFTGFKPIKFREIEAEQPKVTFDRPAPGRFNVMKMRRLMTQVGPKTAEQANPAKGPILAGGTTASAGLSANLRDGKNKAFAGLNLLEDGIEDRENKLDNLASVTGTTTNNQTSFTTYTSASGMQFASTANSNNNDEEDDEKLYNEAITEANDAIV